MSMLFHSCIHTIFGITFRCYQLLPRMEIMIIIIIIILVVLILLRMRMMTAIVMMIILLNNNNYNRYYFYYMSNDNIEQNNKNNNIINDIKNTDTRHWNNSHDRLSDKFAWNMLLTVFRDECEMCINIRGMLAYTCNAFKSLCQIKIKRSLRLSSVMWCQERTMPTYQGRKVIYVKGPYDVYLPRLITDTFMH